MSKNDPPAGSGVAAAETRSGAPTRLGPAVVIQGELTGSEPVLIEGRFQGKISLSRDLTIAHGARVAAEVRATNVLIYGEVAGNVFATERVVIMETGQVRGDITAPRVSINDGAQFRGGIKMEKAAA